MPIKLRGNSYEATVHYKGDRFRKSFPTKLEAESWELQTKADLKSGKIVQNDAPGVKSGPRSLKELMDETHKRYWAGNGGEQASLINAQKCIDVIGPEMHPSMVDEDTIENVRFMFKADGISPATVNRRMSALSKMLSYAEYRRWIPRKPNFGQREKEAEHRKRYISDKEEAKLLEFYRFISNEDMRDLVIVALDTGMRLGEIRRLAPKHLNSEQGYLTVKFSKNGKSRNIPMTERVKAVLQRRGQELESEATPFWKGWTNDRIRHLWNHGRAHLGLMEDPEFVPHIMRHTFCSRLVQRKVPLQYVCALAGHSSITMTMRYAHLNDENLVDAMKMLEQSTEEVA